MRSRLLAIVLADVSGYTSYSAGAARSEIEAAIRQQQKLFPPIVASHGGRIVKWIGDAALIVFESATEAILCGRAMQRTLTADGERGDRTIGRDLKVVVTLGDVGVDDDGDIYGEAVNLAARLEKSAEPGEIYFTAAVRAAMQRAEIPHESVGALEFKGIPEPVAIYRTAFGRSPVGQLRSVLVVTDMVGVLSLADQHGWEIVQPALDEAFGLWLALVRARGGTSRGIHGDGCFVTFDRVGHALDAIDTFMAELAGRAHGKLAGGVLAMRAAVHVGELHVMAHTLMGRDMHVVSALAPAVSSGGVVLTDEAKAALLAEAGPRVELVDGLSALRVGPPRAQWDAVYGTRALWTRTR